MTVIVRPEIGVLTSVISFIVAHCLGKVLNSFLIASKLSNQEPEFVWKFVNISVSLTHALIVGLWDLSCFILYPDLTRDPAFHITPYTYYLVCVSTGYFIYDALDVCWNHRFFKEIEVMLHHFAVVSAFAHNVLTTKCIGYSVIALLVEVNTIFLHLRKLMQLNKVPFTSVVYKIVCAANLITFAIFRGTSLGWITWGMYFEPEKITTMYFYILCMSMFIMNIINPIFFWMLLRRDFLRPFTAKHQSPSLEKLQSSRLSLMD